MLALLLTLGLCPPVADAQQNPHVNYTNITGDSTTTLKPAPGILHSVCMNSATATETITMYDNASAGSGTKIGTITIPTNPQLKCLAYNVNFNNGLTIVTATATSDITVSWE